MPAEPKLPTFFVIGAPKCATTSLHLYLDQHPEIEMSSPKEPQVFSAAGYATALVRYEEIFRGHASVRGESSTLYSQHPRWPGVPERIRAAVAEARFIYLVRDPLERAVAHWRQHVADGKEARPLAEALGDPEREDSLYLCPSRYATQLRRYLESFDRDRILVLDSVDLRADPRGTLAAAFRFLKVDPGFSSPRFGERLNRGEAKGTPSALGRSLEGRPLELARRLPMPPGIRRRARRLVTRPIAADPLAPDLRRRIAAELHPEVEWLRDFTGKPFSSWSI